MISFFYNQGYIKVYLGKHTTDLLQNFLSLDHSTLFQSYGENLLVIKDLIKHYGERYDQNPAEQHYQTVKQWTNCIMDGTNTPPDL